MQARSSELAEGDSYPNNQIRENGSVNRRFFVSIESFPGLEKLS
jgi:hypothetical protein